MFERKRNTLIKTNSHVMELDIERLELILVRFSFGRSFRILARQYRQSLENLPQQFFCNIIASLQYILHRRTDRLRMPDVLFIHESIGIMRVINGNFTGAIGSFTKALWLQRRSDDTFLIGVTQQRLATAYRQQGDGPRALKMFQKALRNYKKSGHDNGTPHVTAVADEMVDLIEKIEGLSDKLISQNDHHVQQNHSSGMGDNISMLHHEDNHMMTPRSTRKLLI